MNVLGDSPCVIRIILFRILYVDVQHQTPCGKFVADATDAEDVWNAWAHSGACVL